jgi:hypothetical protein
VNFFYPYFMRLKEARELTGLSTKTLLLYIKQGKVKAVLVGSGQHRRWEIDPESLEQIERRPPKDDPEDYQESSLQLLITSQQHQIEVLEKELETRARELETRAREISELHVLLQQATAALPAPRDWAWWKFWRSRG